LNSYCIDYYELEAISKERVKNVSHL
jgi:hypothetical protein